MLEGVHVLNRSLIFDPFVYKTVLNRDENALLFTSMTYTSTFTIPTLRSAPTLSFTTTHSSC